MQNRKIKIHRSSKRHYLFLLVQFCICCNAFAQKKALDYDAIRQWPTLRLNNVSSDGKYVTYHVERNGADSLFVQELNGPWKEGFPGESEPSFSGDSRYLVWRTQKDSLCIMDLQTKQKTYLPDVTSFEFPSAGNSHWLAYFTKTKELVVRKLSTGKEDKYPHVADGKWWFDRNGNSLLIQLTANKTAGTPAAVKLLDLQTGQLIVLAHDATAQQPAFGPGQRELAFTSKEQSGLVIRYFKAGIDTARIVVSPGTPGMQGLQFGLQSRLTFSNDGGKLFFYIKRASPGNPAATMQPQNASFTMTVRNYKAGYVARQRATKEYLACINLNNPVKIVRLTGPGYDQLPVENLLPNISFDGRDMPVISRHNQPGYLPADLYLENTLDGSKMAIRHNVLTKTVHFSPDSKYLLWFEGKTKQWYSYNIIHKQVHCITARILSPFDIETDELSKDGLLPEELAGFPEGGHDVFIYDRYDIWKASLDGKKEPVNLTGEYGLRNHIQFRLLELKTDKYSSNILQSAFPVFKNNDTLLLTAFNTANKENGFFKLALKSSLLQKLVMGKTQYQSFFEAMPDVEQAYYLPEPLKAPNANVFVLQRMNTNAYPNIVTTADFSYFRQITDFAPQKAYNWYTSELVHYKLPNGLNTAGILFKPEDFDPKKKYPVIFYYYSQNTCALNWYFEPALSQGRLNMPWYVSHGYLVFVPDIIYYKHGYPGECAANCVISAAKYLSKFPFVDFKHMGIQGHSYGGWETNFILTKTNMFAAACEGAGTTDLVSQNALYHGDSWWNFFEGGEGRMYASFWEQPERYLQNSPLLHANKVITPLLIMHNPGDFTVYFGQATEWYNSLVALGKKVWMLSYTNESHTIDNEDCQLDFSIRMSQFFDHYLKDVPPPKWMTSGQDITGDGKQLGYDLDTSGKHP